MKITQDDLLEALRDALATTEGEDGMTGPELAESLGVSHSKARQTIRKMMGQGRVDIVTLKRAALDGRIMTLKGYRLKAAEKRAA